MMYSISILFKIKYHLNSNAQTGKPTPYMSITFIGKSRPLEEACKHTPRSAQAEIIHLIF